MGANPALGPLSAPVSSLTEMKGISSSLAIRRRDRNITIVETHALAEEGGENDLVGLRVHHKISHLESAWQ